MKCVHATFAVVGVLAAVLCGHSMAPPAITCGGGEVEKCEAGDWFPVTPKPTNEKPADPEVDCLFYQWAWQMFLYSTQPHPGGDRPRFLTYDTPEDVFPAGSTPRFSKKEQKKGTLLLAPRFAKQNHSESLASILQADSQGVVVDQNGRVVYYAQHMNEDFVKFIDKHGFRDVENIVRARPDLEFPKGCVEFKSSWKILGPGDDQDTYFHTTAEVAVLKLQNGKPTIDPNVTRTETVGLIGLHVVGVIDGHPEFIWATFERNGNAPPLCAMDRNPMTNAVLNPQKPVDAANGYTFYPKGTPAGDCNRKRQLTFKSEADQTFDPPTPVFRHFGESEADPAVVALNKNVCAAIDKLAPNLKVWKNYRLIGAVWLNNPAYFREGLDFAQRDKNDPDGTLKILGGERQLSNTAMETFTQLGQVTCFSCHQTIETPNTTVVFPANRIGVSHILKNAYVNAQLGVEEQLRKLEADWATAVATNESKQIGRFLTANFLFVGAGGVLQTRDEHLADFDSGKLKVNSVVIEGATVKVHDRSAVVSSRVTIKGTFDGHDISGPYQFTDTWVKQGASWLAVARQQTQVRK
jgi:hypothetical protein